MRPIRLGQTRGVDLLDDLTAQDAELASIVDPLDQAGLLAPSRCPGWTVADVLLHLAQTNEMAVASAQGRLGEFIDEASTNIAPGQGSIDDWAGALVAAQRGEPAVSRDRWLSSAADQVDAFAGCDPAERVQRRTRAAEGAPRG